MSNLGTAKFKDFPGFLDWYTALPLKDATTLLQECLPLVDVRNPIRNALDNTLSPNWGLEDSEKLWVSRKEGVCRQVRKLVSFSERFDQPLCVQEWHAGRFAYLHTGNSENGIVVPWPEDHLDFTPVKDYTGMNCPCHRGRGIQNHTEGRTERTGCPDGEAERPEAGDGRCEERPNRCVG